ncbi:MAG: hypothetical protein HY318_14260 [Armatimonadetes bacterium]|nr:hypothetical protein [Armatimonadota bacterium]
MRQDSKIRCVWKLHLVVGAFLIAATPQARAAFTTLDVVLKDSKGNVIDPIVGTPVVPKGGTITAEINVQTDGTPTNFWVDFYQDLKSTPVAKQNGNRAYFIRDAQNLRTLVAKFRVTKAGTFHAWLQGDTDGANQVFDASGVGTGYAYKVGTGPDYRVKLVSIISPNKPPYVISTSANPTTVTYQAVIENIGTETGNGLLTVDLFAHRTAAPAASLPTSNDNGNDQRKFTAPPAPGTTLKVTFDPVESPTSPTSASFQPTTYVIVNPLADAILRETDTSLTSNMGSITPTFIGQPDLGVTVDSLDQTTIQASGQVEATFTIYNLGGAEIPAKSSGFVINVYSVPPTATASDVAALPSTSALASETVKQTLGPNDGNPGGTDEVSFTATVKRKDLRVGQFQVAVFVDATSVVTEADEGNNVAFSPYSVITNKPELIIEDVRVTPTVVSQGRIATATVRVKNAGAQPITSSNENWDIIIYPDDNDTATAPQNSSGFTRYAVDTPQGGTLGVGEVKEYSFPFTSLRTVSRSATFVVFARINQNQVVDETDPSDDPGRNLKRSNPYKVVAPPNLVPELDFGSSVFDSTGTITFQSARVRNDGGPLTTYPQTLGVILWKDRTGRPSVKAVPKDSNEGIYGTVTIDQESDEAARSFDISFDASVYPFKAVRNASQGPTLTAWLVVDTSERVAEYNEEDNAVSAIYRVRTVPNLTCEIDSIELIDLSTDGVVPGAFVHINETGDPEGEDKVVAHIMVTLSDASGVGLSDDQDKLNQQVDDLLDTDGDGIRNIDQLTVALVPMVEPGQKPTSSGNSVITGTIDVAGFKDTANPGQTFIDLEGNIDQVPLNGTRFQVFAIVDPPAGADDPGALSETDENDNVSPGEEYDVSGRPDLVIDDIVAAESVVDANNSETSVTVFVRNRGNADSLDSSLQLFGDLNAALNNDGADPLNTLVGPIAFTPLAANGGTTEIVVTIPADAWGGRGTPGEVTVYGRIDGGVDPNDPGGPLPPDGFGENMEDFETESVTLAITGETNNVFDGGATVTAKNKANLTLTLDDVAPTSVIIGESISVTLTAEATAVFDGATLSDDNTGDTIIVPVLLAFDQTNDSTPTGQESNPVQVVNLEFPSVIDTAGFVVTTSVTITPTMRGKTFYVKGFIDPNNVVDESDESAEDNSDVLLTTYEVKAPPAPAQPDLAVIAFSITPTSTIGRTAEAKVTIENKGGQSAGGFWVDFYKSRSTTPTIKQAGDAFTFINSLAPAETVTLSFRFKQLTAKIYRGWVQVDAEQNVKESDETTNNIRNQQYVYVASIGGTLSVASAGDSQEAAGSQLVSWIESPPAAMSAGMNYQVKWEIKGGGSVDKTYVVLGKGPDPASSPLAETDAQSGAPGVFQGWVPAPSNGPLYYQVVAIVDGRTVTSNVVQGKTP